MKTNITKLGVLATLFALLLPGAALASGKHAMHKSGSVQKGKVHKAKVYKDSGTVTVHKTGVRGAQMLYTGDVNSSVIGHGTVSQQTTVNGLTAVTKFTSTFKDGTLSGDSVSSGAIQSDGTVAFNGTMRITKGTGRFKGAKGKGTVTGTSKLDLSEATFTQHTTVTV